jgi:hypothetical protein
VVAPPARRVLGTCPPHRRRVAAGGRGTPPRLFGCRIAPAGGRLREGRPFRRRGRDSAAPRQRAKRGGRGSPLPYRRVSGVPHPLDPHPGRGLPGGRPPTTGGSGGGWPHAPHWPQDRFCRVGGFGRVGGRVLGRSAVAHGVLRRGRERGRLARREAGAGDGVAPPLFGNDQGTLAGNIGMIAKSGKGGFQGSLVGFDAAAGKQPVVPI